MSNFVKDSQEVSELIHAHGRMDGWCCFKRVSSGFERS